MVNNPNSVLQAAIANQKILSTTLLVVSSDSSSPVLGGGVENTAFLQGTESQGANAQTALVTAMFWIELVEGNPNFYQLQYTQTVLLNFNGLSWPHVTVATLRLVDDKPAPPEVLDKKPSDDVVAKSTPDS